MLLLVWTVPGWLRGEAGRSCCIRWRSLVIYMQNACYHFSVNVDGALVSGRGLIGQLAVSSGVCEPPNVMLADS